MPSLKDSIAAVSRAEIAKRAEAEAAVMARVIEARPGRDACAKDADLRKQQLAGLEAKPLDSLPDDDAAIREHLMAIDVAKSRVKIAEKKLGEAEAALAEAQSDLETDKTVHAAAFEKAQLERERMAEDFDRDFAGHAKALSELIASALDVEAQVARANKATPAVRAAGAVRKPSAGTPTLRVRTHRQERRRALAR